MEWLSHNNKEGSVKLESVPVCTYTDFYEGVCEKLTRPECHIASYFACPIGNELVFFCLMLDDSTDEVLLSSHRYSYYSERSLSSLTARHPEVHVFEREISELYGVKFLDSPWDKPLRFTHNRVSAGKCMDNYPFYTIKGESLHEVNVGPIHAGIIEPGAFRFICNGERVLHLEIALGYQHRAIETLMTSTGNRLRQAVISESIAGDNAVGHSTAFATVIEKLSPEKEYISIIDSERAVALELERIAMHIADTAALCSDIGYQLGQVASEALRTIVINSMQLWCGNRFGKGLVRPFGSYYPLTGDLSEIILKNLREVKRRYNEVREDIKSTPSLLARFEDCGSVDVRQMERIGAVGPAARASGMMRDIRSTHPYGVWCEMMKHQPHFKSQGDIMARLLLRGKEIFQSVDYISELLHKIVLQRKQSFLPVYDSAANSSSLAFSLVEGWRGEICHVAVTDDKGKLEAYKIKDPSLHNWMALALSVRGEGISDFPLCNKSFNLSYCGHDL